MTRPGGWRLVLRSAWVGDGALAVLIAALHVSYLWLVPARHPQVADFAGPDGVAVLLALTSSLPLIARRRWPLEVLAVVGLTAVAQAWLGIPAEGFGLIVALYSVAVYAPRRESLVALGIFAFFTAVSLVLADAVQYAGANALVFVTAWVLGDQRRASRARLHALAARARELERERADRARLAALRERARLAAELQDVVAHGLAAMLAQARAADRLLDHDRRRAGAALDAVATTGRESLSELRRLLALLRGSDDADLRPQPALGDIPALVERFRAAGLDAACAVEGDRVTLQRVAETSVYRIVQAALASALARNTSGPVTVTLRFARDRLDVEIFGAEEHAPGGAAVPDPFAGMRERVALLGGALHAGQAGGAFRVHAELPVGSAP